MILTSDRGATPAVVAPESITAWERAEQVARASYGRLVALLASPGGDLELAEDCLAEAFARALQRWPVDGVPQNPEGWLLTAARNRRTDVYRSAAVRTSVSLDQIGSLPAPAGALDEVDPDSIPDRRLALLFVCAHPAIDPEIRAPLMLQTVLGFDARQIARAFVLPASTMAQRLVRAKRRVRAAGIPFSVPGRAEMSSRLPPVLEAIYGTYAIDREGVAGAAIRDSMAAEAHYLAVTLGELLEAEPEALGLAALISLSLARAAAGVRDGVFVPLEEQDPRLWNHELIRLGEHLLRRAHRHRRIGRFQLEAAIQSVHCARATTGETDWLALTRLYEALVVFAPTLGSRLAHAAAVARIQGAEAGLTVLASIADPRLERFQPAWATRAHLLAEAGRHLEADVAYEKAISLTTDTAVRNYLDERRSQLRGGR